MYIFSMIDPSGGGGVAFPIILFVEGGGGGAFSASILRNPHIHKTKVIIPLLTFFIAYTVTNKFTGKNITKISTLYHT